MASHYSSKVSNAATVASVPGLAAGAFDEAWYASADWYLRQRKVPGSPAGNPGIRVFFSRILPLCAFVAGLACSQTPASWTPPKTEWGDPDLQGTWTSDDSYGVPFERPMRYGARQRLTDEEYAARANENHVLSTSIQAGVNPHVGYWVQHEGVEAQPYGSNWSEYARHTSRQTSLIVEPADGHIPALTPQGLYQRITAIANSRKKPRAESWEDLSLYTRCITRGVLGDMLPVMYGNGTEIVQSPGLVAIRYEMIHDARMIPLDGRPHVSPNIRQWLGDSRGHWDGNTLVVETTNFIGSRVGIGEYGDGVRYSDALRLTERFTRVSDREIEYQVTVDDPKTFTAPWTIAFPITHEPGYQIFEYACHEGNYSLPNILSAARAEEKAEAAALARQ